MKNRFKTLKEIKELQKKSTTIRIESLVLEKKFYDSKVQDNQIVNMNKIHT